MRHSFWQDLITGPRALATSPATPATPLSNDQGKVLSSGDGNGDQGRYSLIQAIWCPPVEFSIPGKVRC